MTLDRDGDAFGATLYRLARLYEAPAYVKAAGAAELRGDGVAAHLHADVAGRGLPMHTPAATWASAAAFCEERAAYPAAKAARVSGRLREAAAFWGIAGDIDRLEEKAAAYAATRDDELPDDAFAAVSAGDDGRKERRMRMADPGEVKAAAAWLGAYRDEFLYDDRRAIARRIIARADATGTALPDDDAAMLAKTAGHGTCTAADAAAFVAGRAALVAPRDAKLAADLRALAAALPAEGGTIGRPALAKLAGAIDKCDRIAGLAGRYGPDLERPEDVLFRVTGKDAADYLAGHVETPGGIYRRDALARLSLVDVRDRMGDAFADAVGDSTGLYLDAGKLAAVLPTMPADDGRLFARMAAALGVVPAVKAASAAGGERPALAAAVAAVG